MSNLEIWDKCKHIDLRHLKYAKVNGNQCTTVNGLEMVRIATNALGPIGGRWWYEIAEERFDETKPMPGFEPLMELLHTVKLRLHVKINDEWHSLEQYGHTKARYLAGARTPNPYITFDEEYAKKSTTDALKKCLSLLGVAADVYTGMIDDHQYMSEVFDSQSIKAADENAAKRMNEMEEIKAKTEDALKCIEISNDALECNRLIRSQKVFLSNRLESQSLGRAASAGINKIETAYNQKFNKG